MAQPSYPFPCLAHLDLVGQARTIGNCSAQLKYFQQGSTSVPVSILAPDPPASETYLSASITGNLLYLVWETAQRFPRLATLLRLLVNPIVRKVSRVHQIELNNWLLATNPLPTALTATDWHALSQCLHQEYPSAYISLRNLHAILHKDLLAELHDLGWIIVPYRLTWWMHKTSSLPKRQLKNDRRIALRRSWKTLDKSDIKPHLTTFQNLYHKLYRERYCPLNPDYSEAFLHAWMTLPEATTQIVCSPDDGAILAYLTNFNWNNIWVAPFLGYPATSHNDRNLYTTINYASYQAWQEQQDRNCFYHLSAGVGTYKKARGAKPAWEFRAFAPHHPQQHRLLRAMQAVTSWLQPVIQRLEGAVP